MLEYVFFDQGLRDKFIHFVTARGVECHCSDEDGLLAAVADDLDDALSDAIEDYYDVLLQENAELLEDTEDALEKNAAGVQVQLQDGSPAMIRIDPDMMARLIKELSLVELRDLVQAIAEQVENPDNRPLCHT